MLHGFYDCFLRVCIHVFCLFFLPGPPSASQQGALRIRKFGSVSNYMSFSHHLHDASLLSLALSGFMSGSLCRADINTGGCMPGIEGRAFRNTESFVQENGLESLADHSEGQKCLVINGFQCLRAF